MVLVIKLLCTILMQTTLFGNIVARIIFNLPQNIFQFRLNTICKILLDVFEKTRFRPDKIASFLMCSRLVSKKEKILLLEKIPIYDIFHVISNQTCLAYILLVWHDVLKRSFN